MRTSLRWWVCLWTCWIWGVYEAYRRRCLVGSWAYVSGAQKKGHGEKIQILESFAYRWYSKLWVMMTWSRKRVQNRKRKFQDWTLVNLHSYLFKDILSEWLSCFFFWGKMIHTHIKSKQYRKVQKKKKRKNPSKSAPARNNHFCAF